MKHTITCQCEHPFEVEIPDEVNLDQNPNAIEELCNGSFLTIVCPSCDSPLKPEFPLIIDWPSRNLHLQVLPEFDRGAFYRGQTKHADQAEVVIGYPEAADRIIVIKEGLEPIIIEALKYYLLLKADETNPEAEATAWFVGKQGDYLEFHVHGLRNEEVAVSRIPYSVYTKTREEYRKNPDAEPFKSIKSGAYTSVQNLLRPELD
ncbi:MAG: CpXC domain-containing protein [Treponema sp.]|nr:CpXC domain-containing protein [Treponema sp.]